MRIACFHNFLTEPRGAELAFKNIAIGLAKKGHEIDVYAFDISREFENEFKEKEIRFYSYKFKKEKAKTLKSKILSFIKYMLQYLSVIKKISKEINIGNYDAILVSHWYSAIIIPSLKRQVLYYCQEPPRHVYEFDPGGYGELNQIVDDKKICRIIKRKVFDGILNFITKYTDLWCARRAELIAANSEHSKNILQKLYKKPVVRVYLGVDTEVFRCIQSKKQNFILSIGPLRVFKGHDFVIKALGILHLNKRPSLIIVGDGESADRQYLLELANKLNVNIEIKSNVRTNELVELYNRALATVCAYVREPFGLVAIESMACGTPVIAVKEGGLVETVNNERGILIEHNIEELAEAISRLKDNPGVAKELGGRGSEFVCKNFTWEACCGNLEEILVQLVRKRVPRFRNIDI
ncbi:MAG: glycosyltransferase family 4 protein [Candidatus Thermoplasmatota archaeon]